MHSRRLFREGRWRVLRLLPIDGRGSAIADAVEGVADDVADERSAEDLGRVGSGVDDGDEGVRGDQEAEERRS